MTTPELNHKLLSECYQYIAVQQETDQADDVPELLYHVSYVYLSRRQRLALCWRLFKTIWR